MKKIILLFSFISLIISGNLKANPIAVPPSPILNELYFEGNNWKMELVFHQFTYFYLDNLDSIRIITSTDTAMMKTTITLQYEHIVVITQDSLLSTLFIKNSGDIIRFQHFDNGWYDIVDPVPFGNYHQGVYNSYVNAPKAGQSLVMINSEYYYDQGCYLVLDNHPSIGSPNNSVAHGTFIGIVVDLNHNPIYSKTIIQCKMNYYNDFAVSDLPYYSILKIRTNINGNFLDTNIFARNYR